MPSTQTGTQTLNAVIDLFKNQELLTDYMAKGFIETKGKPCEKWSLGNKLCMLIGGTLDARGYNQWQNVGRQVRKGAKAIYILAPLISTRIEIDDKTGAKEEIKYVYGFKGIPVFRIEDTDIIDAATWEKQVFKPKEVPPLMDIAKRLNIPVVYEETRSGEHGSYNPLRDSITLCTEDQCTFFHELGHAIHGRLLKKNGEKLKFGQDTDQEVIAELFAAVVARIYNLNYDKFAWTYIAGYVAAQEQKKNNGQRKKVTPEDIGRACFKVAKTVEEMLNYVFELQNGETPTTT